MDRLTLCLKEECLGQSEVPQLQEGDSMHGGVVGRRVVQRSDYQNTGGEGGGDTCQVCCPSNMATLARDMVRKASKEVDTVVRAVKLEGICCPGLRN